MNKLKDTACMKVRGEGQGIRDKGMKQLRIIHYELRNGFVRIIRTFSPLQGSSLSLRNPNSQRPHLAAICKSGDYPVIRNSVIGYIANITPFPLPLILLFAIFVFVSCSSTKTEVPVKVAPPAAEPPPKTAKSEIPASYREIAFPDFKYEVPHPDSFRVQIGDSITGYIVEDKTLPLVQFTAYFRESTVPDSIRDRAAADMLSVMFRRGGADSIPAPRLEDSLEFISAGISSELSTFRSSFSVDALSKDFEGTMRLARQILTGPAFAKEVLEVQKNGFIEAFRRRYDNPSQVLSALKNHVNYENNPRLWDAHDKEYQALTSADLKRLAQGKFKKGRIIFALSGDVNKDSAMVFLKKYFEEWQSAATPAPAKEVPPLKFLNKPGIYVTDKEITQANIALNQPFLKRPHPDYYPAAVAGFILGGGGFSSRLTTRIRSNEGLAYSIYSHVDNNYRDTGLTTIALQTKVESAALALRLIEEEIEKLAAQGPSEEELALAKNALIESLPGLFDSPESIAQIFAYDELLGKSKDHYTDYVSSIQAVTAEQVKTMIRRYFSREKMTISIVAPAAQLKELEPFTLVPADSLEFR